MRFHANRFSLSPAAQLLATISSWRAGIQINPKCRLSLLSRVPSCFVDCYCSQRLILSRIRNVIVKDVTKHIRIRQEARTASKMSRTKIKRLEVFSDDSIKRRRTSLKVNLSCTSNLSDSGNDSLGQCFDNVTSHSVSLKSASVVLERLDVDSVSKIRTNTSKNQTIRRRASKLDNVRVVVKNIHSKSRTSKERSLRSDSKNHATPDESADRMPRNSNRVTDHSTIRRNKFLSVLNISENDSIYTALPIGSSTMIDDNDQTSCEIAKAKSIDKDARVGGTDSINTVRTSLNVNTSVDAINETNRDANRWRSYGKKQSTCSVVISDTAMQQSANTVRTSLQMNTSLNASNRSRTDSDSINRSRIRSVHLSENQEGTSSSSDKENDDFDEESSNRSEAQTPEVVSEKIRNEDTSNSIILDGTSREISRTESQKTVFINETVDRSETENEKNAERSISNVQIRADKKCRRKLLPLQNCSQLISFSPVQKEYTPPHCLIFRKKRGKRKKNTRNRGGKIAGVDRVEVKKTRKDRDEKKQKKPRKVLSKKIVVKKIVHEDILNRLRENQENRNDPEAREICNSQGNSSNDFQPLSIVRLAKKKRKKLNIVATGLSNEDKDLVKRVVKALGFAKIEPKVSKNTTHVVTTGVRTINLLHGIIRGCWLVSLEWVLKSLENNSWLNPETYEMTHFSKAVLENRKDRQLFGRSYIPELFVACGCIYIENVTTPRCDILKDLVKAAGGCITENLQGAKIMIGPGGLKETWIFDCITSGELQPYSHYQRS